VGKYITQRIVLSIPTLIGLTLLIFILVRVLMPVDAIDLAMAAAETNFGEEHQQQLREEFGVHGTLPEQYLRWFRGILVGDFGKSFYTGRDVGSEIASKLPVSLQVGAGALLITVVFAAPLGLLAAGRQDSTPDYILRGGAILFYAVPGFWLATLVLVFGSVLFEWAPSLRYRDFWEDPLANMNHLWLPIVLLGLSPIGTMVRLVRTQTLEVIRQDYIRTGRAKGLNTKDLYFKHVLRNSLLPVVTAIGLQVPAVLSGTVIFEQIFLIPGMGRFLLQAIQRLDLYVIMATNLLFGFALIMANLIVDISYAYIDPRIREGR